MENLTPFVEKYGLSGIVVIGCVYILRVIIMWLLARTEAKDAMIDTRHVELVELTRNVMTYVNECNCAIKELVQEIKGMSTEIKGMGDSICSKIDGVNPPEKKE